MDSALELITRALAAMLVSVLLLGSGGVLADASSPASAPATLKPQSTQGHPILIDLLREPPPAQFALKCGKGFCDTRRSYCERIKTDVELLPDDYACRPLPQACLATPHPACGCFPAGTKCDFCTANPVGDGVGFNRTCIGGA